MADEVIKPSLCSSLDKLVSAQEIAGGLLAVLHKGERHYFATGIANLNTGAEMTVDTRWLLGSITKVLTAQLLLQFEAVGAIELDQPVVKYLPDFRLKHQQVAERITVRQLIAHTNGIDSDHYAPETDDFLNASQHYVDGLRNMGVLFEPGSGVHYSNPGFIIAALLLERVSGLNFNRLLERDIFQPCGMADASTSAAQAILFNTAIGAHAGEDGLRASKDFMSVSTGAGAGTTAIVTLDDMLSFAAQHLAGSSDALSADIVAAMQRPVMPQPMAGGVNPGLGWWIDDVGGHRCLSHGGGSPGGLSQLAVFPDLDLAICSFATGPGVMAFHDQALLGVLAGVVEIADLPATSTGQNLSDFEGVFEAFQVRHTLRAEDDGITMVSETVPYDEENEAFLLRYFGRIPPPVTRRLHLYDRDQLLLNDIPDTALQGLMARNHLWSLERNGSGDVIGLRCESRYARKVA